MIVDQNQRKDKRNNMQMQDLFIKKGAKLDATSSVYLETNHIKLLVSVNGPLYLSTISKNHSDDASKMNVIVKVSIPSYYTHIDISSKINTLEIQLEELFSKNILLEKYPRTKLIINIEIFEFSCDILPFAIMGTTLALTEANVEQKGLITCANIIYKNKDLIVDPTSEEENLAEFKLIFGCLSDMQENNLFIQIGWVEEQEFKKAIGTCIKICEAYQNFLISKL
jgi:ribonuclease PH